MADARGGFAALDPCVHCGFCLPACPTYLATGDESDSPRGRILLMRALERGELAPDDPGLVAHLDACLGCRGCEPACPSGVGYGRGLETARERIARATGLPPAARLTLGIFSRRPVLRAVLFLARWLRETGLARRLRGRSRFGFLFGMLDATTPALDERLARDRAADPAGARREREETPRPLSSGPETGTARGSTGAAATASAEPTLEPNRAPGSRGTVALFRGCVMAGLFDHVHEATRRTLTANGYAVVEVADQHCCGALHEHAGDRDGAATLAGRNVAAFLGQADYLVVNSAGCGALLKDLGHLLGTESAVRIAGQVRDVTELLADAGPLPGAPLDLEVGYDPPCHLQHAQRVHQQPLAVLAAIPRLRVRQLPGADRCCGGAGIYGALKPEMSRAVLAEKIDRIAEARPAPEIVATGNPGCLMQIGAGLSAAGLDTAAVHPVELLDRSYRAAGRYDRD